MIKIPIETVISKIKEQKGLSDAEIDDKIKAKMAQLSGLVSREGAAHIVANELGVKVIAKTTGRLKIGEVLSGMRDIEVVGRVTNIFEVRQFARQDGMGQVGSFIVGDESGTVRIVCWGAQSDQIKSLNQSDIVKVQNGYVRENNGRIEIHVNDRSRILVNPSGETVAEVAMPAARESAKRKLIADLKEEDSNVEVMGTIVQVFDPRFYEICPTCQKRAKPQEDGSIRCESHGAVEPAYSYVLNIMLDDGSDAARVVFFKNQAERLLKKPAEAMLIYRNDPMLFEDVKTELLGNQVRVVGRAQKNSMFDRVEFVAQLVDPDPSPAEELEKIGKTGE